MVRLLVLRERTPENRAELSERIEFGLRLRRARRDAGYTLEAAGDAVGVVRQSVSKWEDGTNYPTPDRLQKLAELYGVSVDWLLTGDRRVAEKRPEYTIGPPGQQRGLTGLGSRYEEELSLASIPVLGAISAGGLVEAWQEDLGTLEVPTTILKEAPRAFGLRVYGNSLVSEGIYEGAIVVVDPDSPLTDGKIYAVRTDGGEVAARRVFEAGPVLKLVTGGGEVNEYARGRVDVIGRVRWSFREH